MDKESTIKRRFQPRNIWPIIEMTGAFLGGICFLLLSLFAVYHIFRNLINICNAHNITEAMAFALILVVAILFFVFASLMTAISVLSFCLSLGRLILHIFKA